MSLFFCTLRATEREEEEARERERTLAACKRARSGAPDHKSFFGTAWWCALRAAAMKREMESFFHGLTNRPQLTISAGGPRPTEPAIRRTRFFDFREFSAPGISS